MNGIVRFRQNCLLLSKLPTNPELLSLRNQTRTKYLSLLLQTVDEKIAAVLPR
ncbi:hypothetical protein LINPERPRIM_LOCUS403 [Linum perenne]